MNRASFHLPDWWSCPFTTNIKSYDPHHRRINRREGAIELMAIIAQSKCISSAVYQYIASWNDIKISWWNNWSGTWLDYTHDLDFCGIWREPWILCPSLAPYIESTPRSESWCRSWQPAYHKTRRIDVSMEVDDPSATGKVLHSAPSRRQSVFRWINRIKCFKTECGLREINFPLSSFFLPSKSFKSYNGKSHRKTNPSYYATEL